MTDHTDYEDEDEEYTLDMDNVHEALYHMKPAYTGDDLFDNDYFVNWLHDIVGSSTVRMGRFVINVERVAEKCLSRTDIDMLTNDFIQSQLENKEWVEYDSDFYLRSEVEELCNYFNIDMTDVPGLRL